MIWTEIHTYREGAMTRLPRSTEHIKNEISKLHEQLRHAEAREAERLGHLAVKAGLHEVKASDRTLLKGLRDLAHQFQSGTAPTAHSDKAETGDG
ncbi:TraC family protein [Pelagibacterium luteolum]|uniref:TraC family protein n=1 Tax=Pelagibacterium luteolum TaxID=440168 RepID=UPI001FCE2742|nr:TraC family protein [Pelagibacterium luteolum]